MPNTPAQAPTPRTGRRNQAESASRPKAQTPPGSEPVSVTIGAGPPASTITACARPAAAPASTRVT